MLFKKKEEKIEGYSAIFKVSINDNTSINY